MADNRKCITISIPGFQDEGIYFEGISEANLFGIIDEIVKKPSLVNGINLERLNNILQQMDDINQTSDVLTGDTLDPAYIGDNVIGNASIAEIGKLLFRSNVDGSDRLIPMFSLLSSNGFKISSSNVILTSDPRVENKLYLGNRYFKIVVNPTKPNYLSQLYKSLGFAYIDTKIKNNSTISNVLDEYLDKVSNAISGDSDFTNKIREIQGLSKTLRLRAFLSYVLNDSNVPESVKEIIDQMSIVIESDIEGHLQEHVKQIREQRQYGKSQYENESNVVNTSRAALNRQKKELTMLNQAIYYNTQYENDSKIVRENHRARKNTTVSREVLEETRKRKNSFEKYLERNPQLLDINIQDLEGRNITKELSDLQNALDNTNEIATRVAMYNRVNNLYVNNWNPYALNSNADILEKLVKKDLNLEVIPPRIIKFAGENLDATELRNFLRGIQRRVNVIDNPPEVEDLVQMLRDEGIEPIEETIPTARYQRKFLNENQKIFKLFWNPNNYTTAITKDNFSIYSIINELIQESTIYLPFEDYQSDYAFDIRNLPILTSDKSFVNNSAIFRYRGETSFRDSIANALKVKFNTQKNSSVKVKGDTILIPVGGEVNIDPEVVTYLQQNPTRKLYVDFDSNNNIDAQSASRYLREVVSMVNNTPGVSILNTFIVKGINKIQVETAKAAADLGMNVRVYTDDLSKFETEFSEYNTKSFNNNIYYRFPEQTTFVNPFNSSSVEQAFINKEVTGLLYDRGSRSYGEGVKISKLRPSNVVSIQFPSGNKVQGTVKKVVNFNPEVLFTEMTDTGMIEVGSEVAITTEDGRGKKRWLNGDFYVVGIEGGNYIVSNGSRLLDPVSKSKVLFIAQSPMMNVDGLLVFPVRNDPSKLIEVGTGNIVRMTPELFRNQYAETLSELSRITGYAPQYFLNLITPENASQYGAVEITFEEDMSINSNPERTITKSETETIISTFADKLNSVFGGEYIFVSNQEGLLEMGLTSYEFLHPAFIKDGKIYINLEHPSLHPGSLVHELSHLILGALRLRNPEVYYDLLSRVDLESDKYNNLKVRYKNRLRSDIQEEILADLFGRYFDNQLLDYGSLEEAFNNLNLNSIFKEIFNISQDVPAYMTSNELMNMTINQAIMGTGSEYGVTENLFDNPELFKLRLVSNLKEQLYKEQKLKEICN